MGSTNTVLHLLAIAQEAEADFTMDDIDMLSRKTPCLCKVAPNTHTYHVQDVNRAGGIMGIMNELLKNGLVDGNVKRVDGMTLAEAVDKFAITSPNMTDEAVKKYKSAPAHRFSIRMGSRKPIIRNWIPIVPPDVSVISSMLIPKMAAWLS